jgi:hypothetical protein
MTCSNLLLLGLPHCFIPSILPIRIVYAHLISSQVLQVPKPQPLSLNHCSLRTFLQLSTIYHSPHRSLPSTTLFSNTLSSLTFYTTICKHFDHLTVCFTNSSGIHFYTTRCNKTLQRNSQRDILGILSPYTHTFVAVFQSYSRRFTSTCDMRTLLSSPQFS